MRIIKPHPNVVLWSLALLAVAWAAAGDRVLTRLAAAVERGRLQATGAELAELERDLPEVHAVSRAFKLVARLARPGVVHLQVSGGERARDGEHEQRIREHLKDLVPEDQLDYWLRRSPPAMGSGILLDTDGYVLTNNHVVEGRTEIKAVLYDERRFDATVVGTDPKTDLAVLKIDAPDLHPLKFGDSDALEVGDWVLAVGAPFGLTQTVTHGIVSAKGRRSVAGVGIYYQDFIQTDASINPGNSGGPLLNLRGEVVGVNTAIATHGDGYNAGVAFTIPSNLAVKVANQLKISGTVRRGWLGIFHSPVTPEDVELFGLPEARGVMVNGVLEGSPAARAGLSVEDVVLAVDGVPVQTTEQFQELIADLRPDEAATFDIVRDGQPLRMTVRLGLQPEDILAARAARATDGRPVPALGLHVQTLRALRNGVWRAYEPQQRGAAVVGVEQRDDEVSMVRPGELIVSCNGHAVTTARDLVAALGSAPAAGKVRLEVLEPSGDRRIVTIERRPER